MIENFDTHMKIVFLITENKYHVGFKKNSILLM